MQGQIIRVALLAVLAACGALLLWMPGASAQSDGPVAYSFELSGEINPASAAYVGHALDDAADDDAALVIIRLDTPGGLLDSLRDMNKDIIAAPMPVVVYTYPSGSRAASAGAFLTQAGDVAAMAPETNIGSSTPILVTPGGDDEVLGRKIRNDATAYMRALAEAHGRNPAPGERMVSQALNLTAEEALDQGFIDVIAPSPEALVQKLDGFEVRGPKAQTLDTTGMVISDHDKPLRYELLGLLVNPTIAFLLIVVGIAGLAIELFSPGLVAPGAIGAIAFLLGVFGSSQLPVTALGIALLILAALLLVAEIEFPTHGVLGVAGVVALVLGGLFLFSGDEGAQVSVPVVITAGILLGGLIVTAGVVAMRTRDLPPYSGREDLVGREAEVRNALSPDGQVFLDGALWQARIDPAVDRAVAGESVTVRSVDGLRLHVSRVSPSPWPADEGAE